MTYRSLFAALIIASFALLARQPAQAQSTGDYWKSAAIIGGSTAAGAYIGHKLGGTPGTVIGAGVGASLGYAIDARRRRNEAYNNEAYAYGDNGGYYGPDAQYGPYGNGAPYDGGPYGSNGPYAGNGSYGPYGPNGGYSGPYSGGPYGYGSPYPYPSGSGFRSSSSRLTTSRVRPR
jgi:hypothetical protein